jgi:DNA repair photolyase
MRPVSNPPNPYLGEHREWLEPPPAARVEVYEETARSILSENDSPDIPFRWSVNPYRGCQHACAYCYARPYHEYLGMGAGTDFDTKLVVKTNAAALLRAAFSKKAWRGEQVNFSGVTDCYQPLEAVYKIMRACLEVCREFRNPVAVVTKSFLVMRDAELLAELDRAAGATVYQSIAFADDATARLIEPQAPPPSKRLEAMRRLTAAGVPVGVMVAPIIPGLNDRDIPRILEQAAAAGARSAAYIALRLPGSVEPVFFERIRATMPDRVARIEARIREIRGGRLNDPRFGRRMCGSGTYWESVRNLFRMSRERYGLTRPDRRPRDDDAPASSRPPRDHDQPLLFDVAENDS